MNSFFISSTQGLEDASSYIWLLWNTARSLFDSNSIFTTNLLFYPDPISLAFDTPLLNTLITLPFLITSGPFAAYNFLIIFSFLATFGGFYLFLNYLSDSKLGSLIGASVFTFSAYRLTVLSLGQIDLLSTHWLGFFLYFLFKLIDAKKYKILSICSALFFALTAYTDYRTFIISALLTIFIVFFSFTKASSKTKFLSKIFIFTILTLIFLTPLIVLHYKNIYTFPTFIEADSPRLTTTDVLAFTLPVSTITKYYYSLAMPFIGITGLILLPFYFLGFVKNYWKNKHSTLFLVIALCFLVFSFGSGINILGNQIFTSEYMPYSLLKKLPILAYIRIPARFSLVVNISISVMCVFGFKYLSEKISSNSIKNILFVFLIFLSVIPNFFLIPKLKLNNVENIYYLKELGTQPNGTVLYLPFGYQDSFDQPNGYYDYNMLLTQTIHKKPLVGGYISHVDHNILTNLHDDIFIKQLLKCQMEADCNVVDKEQSSDSKVKYNLKYIVTSKTIRNKRLDDFIENTFGSTYVEDNDFYKILKIN